MTNDYKENLLEYLTGNIAQGISSATPMYAEVIDSPYNDNPNHITGLNSVRCKDGQGNYNGLELYYAHGGSSITLVDPKDMTIIKTFTTFSTGTPLGYLLNLEVDEVGNVYGLDYIVQNDTNIYRIILLNNISEIPKGKSDYEVILRNSYYVQGYSAGDDINPQYETFLAKSTQSATYYFALQEGTGSLLMPSTFQINVGSENTWTRLADILFDNGDVDIGNIYFDNNDQPMAEYYAWEYINNQYRIGRATANGNSEPIYTTVLSNVLVNYYHPTASDVTNFDITLYSNYYGNFYMGLNGVIKDSNNQYKSTLKIFNVNNGGVIDLATYTSPSGASGVLPYFLRGKVVNNNLMLYMAQWSSGDNAKMCFTLLSPDNNINYFIQTDYESLWSKLGLARVGFYNLYDEYNINAIYRETNDSPYNMVSYKIVYNPNRYNGELFKEKSMLKPEEALLFDENNNLILARSLYNVKVYNNQTMATLNVPYNMLNDTTISEESLYGATNYELVNSNEAINKNVYEDLYINFVNAITMENQNTSEYINNINGASRLNKSSSKELDYEKAKATKIRVTYDDETSYITSANNSINNNVCTYTIGVHVPSDKNIQKIEIISNDETTSYQTISSLNLQNNKYYIITQDVYVV